MVKFAVENASDDFPSKRSSKISFQTSPEVRRQFRRKLRQLDSGKMGTEARKALAQSYCRTPSFPANLMN